MLLFRVFDTVSKKFCLAPAPGALWRQEVPSGAVNGSNTNFFLSATPAGQDTTVLFIDGRPVPLSDWTLTPAENKITLNTAPETGQQLYAFYLRS